MRTYITLLVAFLCSSTAFAKDPERVGLLVIDRQAAAAGPALTQAARAQVAKLAEEAVIEMRVAKHTVACNLDTFRALGVDPSFCGVALPKTLAKLYVIESSLRGASVELTLAVFSREDLAMMEKQKPRKIAVDSPAVYAALLAEVH